MARRKGTDRRKMYGLKGPRMETLIKTVAKKINRDSRRAVKKYRTNFPKIQKYMLVRRVKLDERIALARAMDAVGLDPKKPADKRVRAKIQKLGQKLAELEYETVQDPDSRRDPEKHHQLKETAYNITMLVFVAKGREALKPFNEVYMDKMSSLQIAHEEAGQNLEKEFGK